VNAEVALLGDFSPHRLQTPFCANSHEVLKVEEGSEGKSIFYNLKGGEIEVSPVYAALYMKRPKPVLAVMPAALILSFPTP